MTSVSQSQNVATREVTTIVFNNHLPLRTRQEVQEVWLSYDYLDFGGHYFCYCPCVKEQGAYHCWLQHNSAYTTGHSYEEYLGLFRDYDSLIELLQDADVAYEQIGAIVSELVDVIEMPEC